MFMAFDSTLVLLEEEWRVIFSLPDSGTVCTNPRMSEERLTRNCVAVKLVNVKVVHMRNESHIPARNGKLV